LGRKITLLSAAIPVTIGLVLILVATTPEILYVSRIFCGMTYGMSYATMTMYLGEISSDKIRGSIGTLLTVMVKIGILYVYAIGPYVSISMLAWLMMILPALFVLTFIWMPETPYFLLLRNRPKDAAKSLKWLRKTDDVSEELEKMNEAVKKAQDNRGTIRELLHRNNRLGLVITMGMGACQQLCGSQALIAYSEQIFEEVASGLGGSESAIIMAVVQLIVASFSSSIVDRWGRRPLLLLSTCGVTICNTIVGVYFYLLHIEVDMDAHAWLPITTIMIFIITYTIGLATVPFALMSEIFPTNIKALATASFTLAAGICAFIVLKLYQVVSDNIGMHVSFWGFAGFSLFFVIFVYFLVPETKGRPLDVILEDMKTPFKPTLIMVTGAAVYGWTSPTLPKLLADDSPIPTTPDQSSWIASLLIIGSFAGPVITLLSAAIPVTIGLILILVATTPEMLYVSRIFCGITYGMGYASMSMYLGEISSDKIRGSIGTLLTVMAKFGILYVYAIGPYVSMSMLAWMLMILPALFVLTFIWMPETPYFLLLRNRPKDAAKSLKWLRKTDNVAEELVKMNEAVKKAQNNRGTLKDLFSRGNRLSLVICLAMGACQQLCGSQAVIAYSQQIFEEVASGLGGSESAIIMAVVQLITASFSSSIVDRWGRRPLLLLSTCGVTICNTIVGLYFYLLHIEVDMDAHAWLPITTIMIFIITYTVGLATVPFALMSELFPTNIKALATAAFTVVAGACGFGILKLYQVVSDNIGMHVSFWGFAVFSFCFFVFVYFLVPETKGRPLDVILEEMKSPFKRGKKGVSETENESTIKDP
uniref:Facilitated trehalose transporter Tret1 n=1 Tax=Phlebotomus papatasi TaxID=29031 RepID=A0A1B0DQK1_PHLPP